MHLICKRAPMEPSRILSASYLDIIFDNRNKSYGGYELRKHYNQRLGRSAAILLLFSGALVSFSFITSDKAGQLHPRTIAIAPKLIDITPPKQTPKLLEQPHPSTPPQHIKTNLFTPPVITDEPITPQQQMPPANTIAAPGPVTTAGDATGISDAPLSGAGAGTAIPQPVPVTKPLVWVQQMPQFTGDMGAYMNSHLNYPEAAGLAGIYGRVVIQFVVNEDGSVSDAKVVQGIGGGCDEEALRVVNGMPKWKPGKQNGIAVKVYFTLPISFRLEG
jgi:periplasmic protein TonB